MNDTINTANIQVPKVLFQGWQQTVNLLANIVEIPAALIMRVHPNNIEVLVSSDSHCNPYKPNESESLGKGLYCETVIKQQAELLVPNALKDPLWDHNPDLSLGMISYCGLPLTWPNGEPFGTICILDNKENPYDDQQRQLLSCFQQAVEANLETLFQKAEIEFANVHLERRVCERTSELEALNYRLSQEIDSRTAAEKMIYYQSHYHALTGLPNRNQLKKKLAEVIQEKPQELQAIAVLHLGINNFKSINDSFGYQVGDRVLSDVANRITQQTADEVFVAHLNSDEFVVFKMAVSATVVEQAADMANQLCNLFNTTVYIEGASVHLSVSIGVAIYPDDSNEVTDLLRKSSAARNFNKEPGGNSYKFFNQDMQSHLSTRLQVESQLTNALKNNELELYYQPFFDIESGRVTGAEALLRWHNAILGQVPPDSFIAIAEHSGQIIEIGNFVLRTAIAQAARWYKCGGSGFHIAINLSPLQFRDENLANQIGQLLALYNLPPNCLEVEITEGVLLQDEIQACEMLNTFVQQGIRISLDDFGTGYSSLNYLRKFPFDTVKIDRSFIANLTESTRDQELVRAIIAMAHKLKLNVIAEGIETEAQANFVRQEQCELGQGYFYGIPQPSDHFQQQYLYQKAS